MASAAPGGEIERLAQTALKTMATHDVPPTPLNYTLWYNYVARTSPELMRRIDAIIAQRLPFTEELSADLARRYCGDSSVPSNVIETGGRLQLVIDQVRRFLDGHAGEIGSFGQTLDSFSSAIGDSQPVTKMHALIGDLIQETQAMAGRNRTLESRLGKIAGEVSELRENLEVVQREALTDALTGIPNRKFFDGRLKEAAREAVQNKEPLSLLLCDIDHFKRFNDTYGHQIGDQVLKLVARSLADSVKGRDTPARIGGEEFSIILPRTNLQQAVIVANQIRNAIVRRKIIDKTTQDNYGDLTLSFGAAEYRTDEPISALFRRADAALYHAKRAGRNRVSTELEIPNEVAKAS
ncbi:MAG TPA: GGDEF domain-containing protein [Stellaceae bacterium]|nr:GGDEF domain-containing protein [Stellaceae bacterium]